MTVIFVERALWGALNELDRLCRPSPRSGGVPDRVLWPLTAPSSWPLIGSPEPKGRQCAGTCPIYRRSVGNVGSVARSVPFVDSLCQTERHGGGRQVFARSRWRFGVMMGDVGRRGRFFLKSAGAGVSMGPEHALGQRKAHTVQNDSVVARVSVIVVGFRPPPKCGEPRGFKGVGRARFGCRCGSVVPPTPCCITDAFFLSGAYFFAFGRAGASGRLSYISGGDSGDNQNLVGQA